MKKGFNFKLICILIVVASVFVAPTALAEDRTDIPQGYVIFDGTTYYWICYEELVDSYLAYIVDTSSEEAKLAKFYFDTLGDDVMTNMAAYVSDVTTKFVSFTAIIDKYVATGDVDTTYIWFNSALSTDATPAFSVITEVKIMGSDATITGKVYVDVDGYIIIMPSESITIPGNTSITVEANQTDVYLNLYNPATNPCYFKISVILSDSTVLYESGYLLPGEVVGDVILIQSLTAGEYEAKIVYEAYDLSDYSDLNSASVNIKIIAE